MSAANNVLRALTPGDQSEAAETLRLSPGFPSVLFNKDALTSLECLALSLHYGQCENMTTEGVDYQYNRMHHIALHDETLAAMVVAGQRNALIENAIRVARRQLLSELQEHWEKSARTPKFDHRGVAFED